MTRITVTQPAFRLFVVRFEDDTYGVKKVVRFDMSDPDLDYVDIEEHEEILVHSLTFAQAEEYARTHKYQTLKVLDGYEVK